MSNDIYLGDRGEPFQNLIRRILERSRIKPKFLNILLSEQSMSEYGKAFTAKSADPEENYEIYEKIGDPTANKFIVWYMYRRFPQLDCPAGVKVIARLLINYGASKSFEKISYELGFWDFISASVENRETKMKPLLEDVLEAFVGVTEKILDQKTIIGVGYAIVYDILKSVFDEMEISLKYEDLYDAKTRLKELFDYLGEPFGTLKYEHEKRDRISYVTIYRIRGRNRFLLSKGSAALKSNAEQKAAKNALEKLNNEGHVKPVPQEYELFSFCT